MTLDYFEAEPELTGGRIRLRWRFTLDGGGAPPQVRVVRKTRDYEYGSEADFLIYSSAAYPPAGATVVALPDDAWRADGADVFAATESVQRNRVEILRRTTVTGASEGTPVWTSVELTDSDPALTPRTVCYYELRYAVADGANQKAVKARASAAAGFRFGLGGTMFAMLPEIYRRHDVVLPPASDGPQLPELRPADGQLRRFFELFGATFDYIRSRTEALRDVNDLNSVDAGLLPRHARNIGWDLNVDNPVPVQRHEVRYATALYNLTGTIPGCKIWIRRLTGWDAQIHEFARNVFFSNDLGNPDDPTDKGSFTVDTSDANVLANLKTANDQVDYVYDDGQDDSSWYSYNTVGIFLDPPAGATPEAIRTNAGRLKQNQALFLPVNIRGVVIVDVPGGQDTGTDSLKMLSTGGN
ncbi:MAG: hypothetical protein U0Q18_27705 [Bryobacteraceae bacterium]